MNAIVKANGYNVVIGDNALLGIAQYLENARYEGPIFILVDENTYKYALPPLLKAVPELEDVEIIQVMNGEEQKSLEVCMDIWDVLTQKGANEQSLLINLGGGMVCEMGAFVAAAYKGGIDFIHVPTSLLAITTVSAGGSAALNFGELKNQ